MKTCYRCKETKEISLEFFYKDKQRPTGFANLCKECKNAENKIKVLKRKEQLEKKCKRCDKKIKGTKRADAIFCNTSCRNSYINKTNRYNRKAIIKEKECKVCSIHFKTNRCNIRCCSIKCSKANNKKLQKKARKTSPEKYKAISAKYKAKRALAAPPWLSKEQYDQIKLYYRVASDIRWEDKMQVDHIVPIRGETVCGLHVPWNLQILSPDDNLFKRAKFDGTNNNEGWKL